MLTGAAEPAGIGLGRGSSTTATSATVETCEFARKRAGIWVVMKGADGRGPAGGGLDGGGLVAWEKLRLARRAISGGLGRQSLAGAANNAGGREASVGLSSSFCSAGGEFLGRSVCVIGTEGTGPEVRYQYLRSAGATHHRPNLRLVRRTGPEGSGRRSLAGSTGDSGGGRNFACSGPIRCITGGGVLSIVLSTVEIEDREPMHRRISNDQL
jgi:hypothetical protein